MDARRSHARGEEIYSEDVFNVLIEYEISRSNRYPSPISILKLEMIPTALDEAAMRAAPGIFASALNAHLRSVDIPSGVRNRFRVLLPTTEANGARAVCERIISVFRSKFTTKEGSSVAFSVNIGAASHPGGSSLTRELLDDQSETALKQSKLKGANTYVLFQDI